MTPDIVYFLQVNGAIALFYIFYRLFLYKDTFFGLRRTVLLAFFGIAFLYPLMDVREWMREQLPIAEAVSFYASAWLGSEAELSAGRGDGGWELPADGLIFVYLAGVVVLSVRFLIRLGSVAVLSARCRTTVIGDVRVWLLESEGEPCSFFNRIFIHPAGYGARELEEILTHERAHVRQWHSLDVVLYEWLAVVCWINPFVWLMKREVRRNLEYLADRAVLRSGYDSKVYQYHLLGSARFSVVTELPNRFYRLPLKNRIAMMNRKRTHACGRIKYGLLFPLTALLMFLGDIDATARPGGPGPDIVPLRSADGAKPEGRRPTRVDDPFSELMPAGAPGWFDETGVVYAWTDEMPRFLADNDVLEYIETRIRYPQAAAEKGIQGRVVCSVVIGRDGGVGRVKLLRGVHPLLDAEALRVLKALPKWNPGKQSGVPVPVRFTVPITFKLL